MCVFEGEGGGGGGGFGKVMVRRNKKTFKNRNYAIILCILRVIFNPILFFLSYASVCYTFSVSWFDFSVSRKLPLPPKFPFYSSGLEIKQCSPPTRINRLLPFTGQRAVPSRGSRGLCLYRRGPHGRCI